MPMLNGEQRFSMQPNLGGKVPRTIIPMHWRHMTTFNTGQLIPMMCLKYLPGDTHSMKIKILLRSSTPLVPVMDNAYVEIAFFGVPERIVWEHAKEYRGENKTSKWEQTIEYRKPTLQAPQGGFNHKTIADHFGFRPGVENIKVDALPYRGYALIYNEFYRDQNNQDPILIDLGDTDIVGSNGSDKLIDAIKGGAPLKVCKFHDQYTTALPEPQKGQDVLLPLGVSAQVKTTSGSEETGEGWPILKVNKISDGTLATGNLMANSGTVGITSTAGTFNGSVVPTNLIADLTNATAASINDLRQAIVVQQILERNARGGTRYRELIKSAYDVTIRDQSNQIPEYLGGKRIPINMNQVVQTSATNDVSPQGSTAAFSLTVDASDIFTKSFDEWGYIIGLIYVRNENTYQDGIERQWFELEKWDEYDPMMANIGEQPILNREIYAQGTNEDEEIFGYQEAWYNYRYKQDQISGEFRSDYSQSLDFWHYADKYNSLPILGNDWIEASKENVDRTLAIQSDVSDQWHADIYFENTAVRCMPLYSVPGLSRI